jgi:hypothetical protein
VTRAGAIVPNAFEQEIALLVTSHPQQGRATMVHDPTLNLVARAKAIDLGTRRYFAHVDPDGYGPNKAIQLAGYQLPASYLSSIGQNNVESLSEGVNGPSAQMVFNGWLGSAGHRRHVLAETAFYAGQTRYGVGYANFPAIQRSYTCFVSAPPDPRGNLPVQPYSEWLFSYFVPKEIDTNNDLSDTDGDGIARIVEFVLNYHPKAHSVMPGPVFNTATRRLEWNLPVRSDLGSVVAQVQYSADLTALSWTTSGVQRNDNVFWIPQSGAKGFLRLTATRP